MPYVKDNDGVLAIANTQVDDTFQEVVELPEGKLFRDAFVLDGDKVVVDLVKAKEVAHGMRRAARDEELAPLDRQATYDPEGAEPQRVAVRAKYEAVQDQIDAATDVEELTNIMLGMGND